MEGKKIAPQDFVPVKYKAESCEQVEAEFIVREISRAKISAVMNVLMALNTSNCPHMCIAALTLSMSHISSVPITPVHVPVTQILPGFSANEKENINCHFVLRKKRKTQIYL